MLSKINLELALSRNFDKVTIGVVDEPIQYENMDGLQAEIQKRFAIIRNEIDIQFEQLKKKNGKPV